LSGLTGARHSILNNTPFFQQLGQYPSAFPEELGFQQRFIDLLQHPGAFHRDHLPGHITGSAWIVNQDVSKILLVLHAKLGRWLQPGGHADGEENVLAVARREAEEETGLKKLHTLSPAIFDLDIHPIPARPNFPAHLHYDVRFLLQASEREKLVISEESTGLRWFSLKEIPGLTGNNKSIMRMLVKTSNLGAKQ
jgi:8-oxo-dGTP pyrophosphatase MutT (NUDIX family)